MLLNSYGQRFAYFKSDTSKFYFDNQSNKLLLKFNSSLASPETFISGMLAPYGLSINLITPTEAVNLGYIVELTAFASTSSLEQICNSIINRRLEFAYPIYFKQGVPIGAPTNRVLVKLKNLSDKQMIQSDLSLYNLTEEKTYEYDAKTIFLKGDKGTNLLDVSNSIHISGKYQYCIVDWLVFFKISSVNDPYFPSQWGLQTVNNNANLGGININGAWEFTMGCSSIKIAVLDVGVDILHEDLNDNLLAGFNAYTNTSDVQPGQAEQHGTLVTGIIGAEANNNTGIAGVAPKCKIIPIKVLTRFGGTISACVLGLDKAWSDFGADVLNCSWGSPDIEPEPIKDAVIRATTFGRNSKGAVVVFATGNDDRNGIHFPSKLEETIAVGAYNQCDQRKSLNPLSCDGDTRWGSNYGAGIDVVAPGVNIYTTDITSLPGNTSGDYDPNFWGTSSAAPFVSGVAGLMLSLNPNLTLQQIKHHLYANAGKIGTYSYGSGGDLQYTWNNEMGYGKVNANNAVVSLTNPQNFGIQATYTALYNPLNPPNTILRESGAWFNYFYSAPRCCGEQLNVNATVINPTFSAWTGSWSIESNNNPNVQILLNSGNSIQVYYYQSQWPNQNIGFNLIYTLTGPCGQKIKALYQFKNSVDGFTAKRNGNESLVEIQKKTFNPIIYPNPVIKNSEIVVELGEKFSDNKNCNTCISIVNLQGVIIKKITLNNSNKFLKISSAELSSGLYLLKLENCKETTTLKLIVQ